MIKNSIILFKKVPNIYLNLQFSTINKIFLNLLFNLNLVNFDTSNSVTLRLKST